MAPFVVPGSKGVELTREGSVVSTYKAPLMRPTRTITPGEILVRGFGEAVYSVKTPEERASEMRADDLSDLRNAILRRQEWMAAQLLLNGGYEINGFADDGKTAKIDNISFPAGLLKTSWSFLGKMLGISPPQLRLMSCSRCLTRFPVIRTEFRRLPSALELLQTCCSTTLRSRK